MFVERTVNRLNYLPRRWMTILKREEFVVKFSSPRERASEHREMNKLKPEWQLMLNIYSELEFVKPWFVDCSPISRWTEFPFASLFSEVCTSLSVRATSVRLCLFSMITKPSSSLNCAGICDIAICSACNLKLVEF